MKKEDIDFLRELQHELNTQETDSQAAPRFWVVAEEQKLPAPNGCGDIAILMDGTTYTAAEFVNYIENDGYNEGCLEDWNNFDKDDEYELVEFAKETLGWDDVEIVYECVEPDAISNYYLSPFLTKRACQQHIELNGYHYTKPHTYAMTAWRNPEFERLMKIIQEMNVDDIKVD